ncbi:hypothetical protein Q9189_002836 [Teloschistes chrysophthalmus]
METGIGALSELTPISASTSPRIAQYWHFHNENRALVDQHHIQAIQTAYRAAFRSFFADPLSLHGHVSDASNPSTLLRLMEHLYPQATNPKNSISNEARKNPRIAVTEGYYGAAYGPLVYHAKSNAQVPHSANGARPTVITTNDYRTIEEQLRNAKEKACVAVIAEMVRSRDGSTMETRVWEELCGAPFAHQLLEYHTCEYPDLVLFGKAVGTHGVAVEWRGSNIKELGIVKDDQREHVMKDWQKLFT